jgi:hypothetical protein
MPDLDMRVLVCSQCMWHYRAPVSKEKVSFLLCLVILTPFFTKLIKKEKKMYGNFMFRRVLEPFSKLVIV